MAKQDQLDKAAESARADVTVSRNRLRSRVDGLASAISQEMSARYPDIARKVGLDQSEVTERIGQARVDSLREEVKGFDVNANAREIVAGLFAFADLESVAEPDRYKVAFRPPLAYIPSAYKAVWTAAYRPLLMMLQRQNYRPGDLERLTTPTPEVLAAFGDFFQSTNDLVTAWHALHDAELAVSRNRAESMWDA